MKAPSRLGLVALLLGLGTLGSPAVVSAREDPCGTPERAGRLYSPFNPELSFDSMMRDHGVSPYVGGPLSTGVRPSRGATRGTPDGPQLLPGRLTHNLKSEGLSGPPYRSKT